jgi:cation:H+ antiporter
MTGIPDVVAVPAFPAGALVSLATSWVLVSRLERVGERLGLSEALLGLVAALAADAPEVTAAIAAMAGHQQRLGAGVVIGSNVFNLAALLGLGAVVAGRIGLHRKVVILGGAVAAGVAAVCLAVVLGLAPAAGLALALAVVAAYAVLLGAGGRSLGRLPLSRTWIGWLRSAVAEEELELGPGIRPQPGRRRDVVIAAVSLLVVVAASITMERAASALGTRFAVPEIVTGGLVLAAVTSLPNAVAAVYLAGRGRGAATLSTALNSNTLNVAIGLLIPATVIGLGRPTSQTVLIAAWYVGLTTAVLALTYHDHGLHRPVGAAVIAAYLVFAGSLLASAYATGPASRIAAPAGAAAAAAIGAGLILTRRRRPAGAKTRRGQPPLPGTVATRPRQGTLPEASANGHVTAGRRSRIPRPKPSAAAARSLLPGWTTRKLWALGLALSCTTAAADAVLGHRVVLIGLLIVGPCCVLLTGRWVPTGLTGLWVTGLAVILGIPDHMWGTSTHLAFLAAVAAVALATTIAAALIQTRQLVRPR